jgi:hypothetical protein
MRTPLKIGAIMRDRHMPQIEIGETFMGNLRVRVRKISFSFVLQIFLRSVIPDAHSQIAHKCLAYLYLDSFQTEPSESRCEYLAQSNNIGLLINSDQTCTQGNQVIYIGEFPFAKFRFFPVCRFGQS